MLNFLQGRLLLTRTLLILVMLTLVTLGILTIYAIENPATQNSAKLSDDQPPIPARVHNWDLSQFTDWQNWQKQLIFAGIGLFAFAAVNLLNYRRLGPLSYWLYGISLILLMIVLIGKYVHLPIVPLVKGSYRWIRIPGLLQFQPSELTRLTFILALAWFLRYRPDQKSFFSLLGPFALTLLAIVLILLEPDLGTVLLFMPVLFAMLFVSGAKTKYLLTIIALAFVASPLLWTQMESYQRTRVATVLLQSDFLRAKAEKHPSFCRFLLGKPTIGKLDRNEGYQLGQSKLAIATGSYAGQGFAKGPYIQYNLLPERHNDFIFSIFAHQFGFRGSCLLLGLYAFMIALGLNIALYNTEPFGRLISVGIVTMLAVQILVNISMTVGLAPVTGLTLPLMSYGGSSLLTTMIALGLLNNVGRFRPFSVSRT